MKSKLYQYRNVGFTFNPAYRKWSFTVDNNTLLQECPGGVLVAEKVARQVEASWRRGQKLADGLAVAAIRKITHPVVED